MSADTFRKWTVPLIAVGVLGLAFQAVHQRVFHGLPFYHDEYAYLFQAKTFAAGCLSAPSPKQGEFFWGNWIVDDGTRWYSKYFPGHALILTLAVKAGMAHVMPALLMALTAVPIYLLALRTLGFHTAVLSILIYGSSPGILLTGGTYLSQTSSIFLTTLWIYLTVTTAESQSTRRAISAAAALGLLGLVRPYTAVASAVAMACYAALGRRRDGFPTLKTTLLVVVSGAVLTAAGMMIYNRLLLGDWFSVPHFMRGERPFDRPGFFVFELDGEIHIFQFPQAVRQFLENLQSHIRWTFGSWLFFAVGAASLVSRSGRRWVLLSALLWSALAGFHFFFYGQPGVPENFGWGILYYLEAIPFLSITIALGLTAVWDRLSRLPQTSCRICRTGLVLALGVTTLATFVERAERIGHTQYVIKSPYLFVRQENLKEALVFIHTVPDLESPDHAARPVAFAANSPFLDDPVLFAWDRGRENASLAAEFPERKSYHFSYDPVTRKFLLAEIVFTGLPDTRKTR